MKLTITKNPAVYEATGVLLKNCPFDHKSHALITPAALYTTHGGILFKVPLEQDQEPGVYEVIARTKAAVTLLKTDIIAEDTYPVPMLDESIFKTEGLAVADIPTGEDLFFCDIIRVTMGAYKYKDIIAVRNAMMGDVTLYYTAGKPNDMIILTDGDVIACVMPIKAG